MDARGRKLKKPPACVQCRRKKIGCDRVKPVCGNCVKFEIHDCFYPDVPGQFVKGNGTSTSPVPKSRTSSVSSLNNSGAAEVGLNSPARASRRSSRTEFAEPVMDSSSADEEVMEEEFEHPEPLVEEFVPRVSAGGRSLRRNPEQYIEVPQPPALKPDELAAAAATAAASYNAEIEAMAQVREYNTKLQILHAQQRRKELNSADSTIHPKHISPVALEGKNLLSVGFTPGTKLKWVQGPALFDIYAEPYDYDENILKEMEFLRTRLVELQDLLGRKASASHLNYKFKKRKATDSSGKSIKINPDQYDEFEIQQPRYKFNEFRDLDPNFLNHAKIFSLFDRASILDVFDKSGTAKEPIFEVPYMSSRDKFLTKFFADFHDLVDKNFHTEMVNWQPVTPQNNNKILKSDNLIFPPRHIAQEAISKFQGYLSDIPQLISVLKLNDLMITVEQIFTSDNNFSTQNMKLTHLIYLGQISVMIAIVYHSLATTVLIPLKDNQVKFFEILKAMIPYLDNNISLTKIELSRRTQSNKELMRTPELVAFFALWKFYQFINDPLAQDGDFDEDVLAAREACFNFKTRDQYGVTVWNFITRCYSWRNLFKGLYPFWTGNQNFNSSMIVDPILSSNKSLLDFESDLIKYLTSTELSLSIEKIMDLKEEFTEKFQDFAKNGNTLTTDKYQVIDSLIYRNSLLYIHYYLVLHFEELNDKLNYKEYLNQLLKLIQESLYTLFSSLSNLKLAGYEFMFANLSFVTIGSISQMLLALNIRAIKILKCSEVEGFSKEHGNISDMLTTIINKVLLLLEDYIINCRTTSLYLQQLLKKLKLTLSYIEMLHNMEKADFVPLDRVPNGLRNLDEEALSNSHLSLKAISESLIKSDYYRQRRPYKCPDPKFLGINANNFNEIYGTMKV